MRSKNFKGSKCVKMKLSKSDEVVKTFDNIQTAYAQILDKNENIQMIQCNVVLEEVENGESSISITDVKGDLFWVDSKSHTNYRVVPFNKVTTSMLYNKDSVYAKYSAVINKYKNDAIKVGHFEW